MSVLDLPLRVLDAQRFIEPITDTDILHFDLMGSHLVVINDSGVAADLLERRSVINADRVCKSSSSIPSLTPPPPLAQDAYGERTVRVVIHFPQPLRQPTIYSRMGCTWSFLLMQYGNTWRIHRRLFHRFFNTSAAGQFDDKIHKEIGVFLRRLSESPKRFLKHAHLYVRSPISILELARLTHLAFRSGKPGRVPGIVGCVRSRYSVRE